MKRKPYLLTTLFFGCLLMSSCVAPAGVDGLDGFSSLISTEVEQPGDNCEAGGIQVNHGMDLDSNGILDTNEIQHSDYICNGTSGNLELDNLTRVSLGSLDAYTCDPGWFMTPHQSWQLLDFNKHDYANVSSILFVPSMVSYEPGNIVTVELYNVTDNVPIANTQLTHDNGNFVFKYSGDIYNDLPDYPVTLSIRMQNSMMGACGGLGSYSYLYIMRE